MRRFGKPEELVGVAVLLASDAASLPHRPVHRSRRRLPGLRSEFVGSTMSIKYCLLLLHSSPSTPRRATTPGCATPRSSPAPALPAVAAAAGESPLVASAQQEIIRGLRGMTGRTLRAESGLPQESAIVLGTLAEIRRASRPLASGRHARPGRLLAEDRRQRALPLHWWSPASDERGVLYGAFALLRKIALGEPLAALDEQRIALRAGPLGESVGQPGRHHRARLRRPIPSSGKPATCAPISAASPTTAACWPRSASTAAPSTTSMPTRAFWRRSSFRRSRASPMPSAPGACGWRIAVDFGSPKTVGGLDTFDPLDPQRRRLVEGQASTSSTAPFPTSAASS